jgi:hypothetical protein
MAVSIEIPTVTGIFRGQKLNFQPYKYNKKNNK